MMKWPTRNSRTPIGLQFDSRSFTAVQLSGRGQRYALEAATVITRSDPSKALQPAEVRRLADVLYRQGFAGSDVVLVVPLDMQMTEVLELPAVGAGAPLAQLARMELSRIHRCEPQSLEMAWWDLPARRRAAEGVEIMTAGCRVSDAETLLDVFEGQHMQVRALDVAGWAMRRACGRLLENHDAAVLLNIGWDCCTMVLIYKSIVVYERVLPDVGLQPLHRRLIEELRVSAEQADMLLKGSVQRARMGAASPDVAENVLRTTRPVIEAQFASLIREMEISYSYISQRYDNVPFEQALLMGPGAGLDGLAQQIGDSLGMTVRTVSPADVAECPARLERFAADPALIMALGLAMHAEATS